MPGRGPSAWCLNAEFGVHCSQGVRVLMAWVVTRLCCALHVHVTFGSRVIEAARIGSSRSCMYTTFWITGSSILAINGTAPGVLLRVCR